MIVIKGVDYYHVQDDITTVIEKQGREQPMGVLSNTGVQEMMNTKVYHEIVQGREFYKENGERVVIAVGSDPAELLGIHYDIIEGYKKKLEGTQDDFKVCKMISDAQFNEILELECETTDLRLKLIRLEQEGFWKTITRAFKKLWEDK